MALTDIAIKSAKPRERDYKMADGGGLYQYIEKVEREGLAPATISKLNWARECCVQQSASGQWIKSKRTKLLAVLKKVRTRRRIGNGETKGGLCQPRISLCSGDGARKGRSSLIVERGGCVA